MCEATARGPRRVNAILLLDDGESCARIAKNFSTWTAIPSGAAIRATGKMAGMRLPSMAGKAVSHV